MGARRRRAHVQTATLLWLLALGLPRVRAQEPPSAAPPPAASNADAAGLDTGKPSLRIDGFGDITLELRPPQGAHPGFRNGALDLYTTSQISDHWSSLAELVFENEDNKLETDLERFVVTYEHSSRLRLDLGRLHNPLIRWNVSLHHGVFLQTPIDRPVIARFEDEPGLWPVHFVGLLASGRLPGPVGLSYEAAVGNGRGRALDEVQVTSDANGWKAVLVSLGASLALGWEVHATSYFDEIPAAAGEMSERDFTFSTSYLARGLELRAEWARLTHEPKRDHLRYRTTGWYALMSRRLPGRWEPLRPYVLVERLQVAKGEAFLEGVPDERAWLAGLRWDVNRGTAIKLEYRSRRVGAADREGLVLAQVAVSF